MAIVYDATITPGKRDLMKAWLPSRSWFDGDLDRKPVGSFRFDDPDGEVGIEFFLIGGTDGPTLLIPMTYRAAPLDGALRACALTLVMLAVGLVISRL